MKKYLKYVKQGAIASAIAGGAGVIFGLIRGISYLRGANQFIYILGLGLVFYSVFSSVTTFHKTDENEVQKVLTKDEVEKHMHERKEIIKDAPKSYVRAVTVMIIAILLEYIRFNIL